MTPLSNLPGQGGNALGVNDSGEVSGFFSDAAGTHAFLWTAAGGGTTTDVGATLPVDTFSKAFDVNNAGEAVGEYLLADGATYHAFLYNPATGMSTDLNDATIGGLPAGFGLQQARAIDASGRITGLGVNSGGAYGAFILSPALPGDANLDGKVNVNDLTVVLTNFGQGGMTWSQGDFNGDGKVDVNDLTMLLTDFGKSLGTPPAGVQAVPEPGAPLLLIAGLAGTLVCRRWRKG